MNALQTLIGLPAETLALAALMTFGAAAIRGLTGFGMAIVLVPLLGIIIRPDQAVVLAIVLQVLIGPVGLKTVLADLHRPSAPLIAGFAVLATPLGIWLLALTAPDVARLIIAGIACGAFALVISSFRATSVPGGFATIAAGLAAGVLTGFAAMPGPPVVPYYLRSAFTPLVARASMMLVFFAAAISGTASAWLIGMLDWRTVMLALLLFVPMVIGNALGQRGFGKVSPPVWRGGVALLLGVAAISAVVRAFS